MLEKKIIFLFEESVVAKKLHLSVFKIEAFLRRDVSFIYETNEREASEKRHILFFSTTIFLKKLFRQIVI